MLSRGRIHGFIKVHATDLDIPIGATDGCNHDITDARAVVAEGRGQVGREFLCALD